MRNLGFASLAAVMAMWAAPANAGLVVNGTFNTDCSGWAFSQTDSLTCSTTEGNPPGSMILNNGPGPVPQASQSIAGLIAGDVYRITLDAKSHYNCCNSNSTPGAGVGIDGQQFDFLIVNSQPWTAYQFDFTYGGGSNLLVVSAQRNGTDSDGQFDNVDINLLRAGPGPVGVPEPATLALLGAGLVGLGALRRRKAK